VPDHGGRLDPVRAPQRGQRHHDGEERRLDDVDPVEVLAFPEDGVE
jgi:hypothetical protein